MITEEGNHINNIPIESIDSLKDEYELGATIGRGEFAKVKIAKCRRTKQIVAIKIVPLEKEQTQREERLYQEISILSSLDHQHIIKLLRVFRLPDRLALVMEYASGGELFDHVQSRGHLPESKVRILMDQIFMAVEYLHQHHIVHRDLKLENILLDDKGQIRLTDFGFTTHFETTDTILLTACGSPCYAAPELVLNKTGYNGPAADIWSCGVIMYAMSYGYLPYESDLKLGRNGSDPTNWTPTNVYNLYQHIANNPLQLPKPPNDGLSSSGQDLLLRLLTYDPSQRLSFPSIWSHPWWTLEASTNS